MAFVIFDLDHTVIDSSHRQATLPDGSLDLAHWFENNTPEKIMQDSLLPLADTMRKMYSLGHHVIVCTARSAQPADKEFCKINNLPYHAFLHREMGNMDGDADLKIRLLSSYFEGFGLTIAQAKAIMFDDNLKVINALIKQGVRMYNAIEANKALARIAA